MGGQVWEVVGGADRGGIIVRTGQHLTSEKASGRLSTGALVREEELVGERLHFSRITGTGPDSGWVSVRSGDKELLVPGNQTQLRLLNETRPFKTAQPPPSVTALPRAAAAPGRPQAPSAAVAMGPKQVWFIRHGEAEHNVLIDQGKPSGWLRDPALSPLGMEQACDIAENRLLRHSAFGPRDSPQRAELIVSSPCRRALQTACSAASRAVGGVGRQFIPMVALPDLQECTDNPCDTGRPKSELEGEFFGVDWTELGGKEDSWFVKVGSNRGSEGRELLQQRCDRVTAWLAARPEQRMVVVAHRTLFCYMLQLDFAPAEVIEMRLAPSSPAGSGRPASGWSWEVVRASDTVIPFFNHEDKPLCSQGSPPLRGTLATCRQNRGEDAARNTAKRAGLPWHYIPDAWGLV